MEVVLTRSFSLGRDEFGPVSFQKGDRVKHKDAADWLAKGWAITVKEHEAKEKAREEHVKAAKARQESPKKATKKKTTAN